MSAADKARVESLERLAEEMIAFLEQQGDYPSFVVGFRARLRALTSPASDEAAEVADTLAPPPEDGSATLPPEADELGTPAEAQLLREIASTDTADEAWLLARSKGETVAHPDPERAAGYERLEDALKNLPLVAPPPGLEGRVLAAIDHAGKIEEEKEGKALCRMPSSLTAGASSSRGASRACATSTSPSGPA